MSIVVDEAPISTEQITETPVVEQEVQQEVQAEPEDTAISLIAIINDSPST